MTDPARPGLFCGQVPDPMSMNPTLGTPLVQQGNTWGLGQDGAEDAKTTCVDAMYAASKEWDMLGAWLNRKGIDGQGRATGIGVGWQAEFGAHIDFGMPGFAVILGRVSSPPTDPEEPPPPSAPADPAHRQLSSMDIVGHEFGHMVFQTTPGSANFASLENRALNEGTADIMAQLTIAFANTQPVLATTKRVPLTYTMGSQLDPESPFRVMYKPSLVPIKDRSGNVVGFHPDCYSSALFTKPNGEPVPVDSEGHSEAGPLNHWFYLLAQGSNPAGFPASPTCDGSTLSGLGIKTAGQIWYNALLQKTTTWTYRDACSATLTAALRLFPGTRTVFDKVKAAWNAVSVPALSNEPTCGVGLPTTGAAAFTSSGPSGTGPRTLALLLFDALAVVGVAGVSIVWLRTRRPRRCRI